MTKQRPIDQKREAGGSFEIGSPDEGEITSTVEIGGSLYIVKKHAIYAIQMADQIDPERKNIDLPNVIHRQVLSEGSDSELVGRTLLTAANLFAKGKFLPSSFQHERALALSLDALTNIVAMRTTATEFDVAQQVAWTNAQNNPQAAGSMKVPAMSDVRTRCKTFAQRADHAARALFDITQLFYPDLNKGGWEALLERATTLYGADDYFTKFLGRALPFLLLVRNSRDCLEHNLTGAVVSDFKLLADGQLVAPTIEINFRKTHQPTVAVAMFMTQVTDSMITAFEVMIACLCSKHIHSMIPNFPIVVGELPEDRRRGKHVRYCYGTYHGKDFVPVG